MKSRRELHQALRQRILNLPVVTERENAGLHEDAFFVGHTMFMHIHPESFRGCGRQSTPSPMGAGNRIRHVRCEQ